MRARLPWILFAISLTLNLAIAGAIAWHWWNGPDRALDRAPVMQAANALHLQGDQREKFLQFRQTVRQSFETMRQSVRPLRRELLSQLAKPQPDFDAIDRLIDQLGDQQGTAQKAMVRAFAEFHASLTPEQRQEFRKHLRERAGGRLLDAIVNPGGPRGERQGPPRQRDGANGPPGNPPPGNPPTAPTPVLPPATAPAPSK